MSSQPDLPFVTSSSRTMIRVEGDAATVKNYTEECRALAQSMGLRIDVATFSTQQPNEDAPATPRPPALGPKPEGA